MGGGVSLGAFSGAALTEAIKLALLRIAEANKSDARLDYDKVEVDVFSGASAGSLSLALMLRGLTWRTQEEVDVAKLRLATLYPGLKLDELSDELREDLVAAQVAQDLQERAWVELINLEKLLGGGGKSRQEALRHAPGLLDSEAVYHIARTLLLPQNGQSILWQRRLLAGRCLYACTLTSLTPFVADATSVFTTNEEALPGLRDALRSRLHKDLRVFDLLFDRDIKTNEADESNNAEVEYIRESEIITKASKRVMEALQEHYELPSDAIEVLSRRSPAAPKYPPRWFRLHNGESKDGVAWNYQERESWAVIAATAIASGAFPGAFAPAVLQRFSWEYGWRKDGDAALNAHSIWPAALKKAEATEHPFAYADGGVFNNDPVREAYRMVSFVDGREEQSYLRRVIFVDPSVSPEDDPFNVPTLIETGMEEARWFNLGSPDAARRLTTLPRLMSLIGNVVGLLIHQGRSREADGVLSTRDDFAARLAFRDSVRALIREVDDSLAQKLRMALTAGCNMFLGSRAGDLIPPGDGSQTGELKRVLRELKLENMADDVHEYDQNGFKLPALLARKADWLWAHLSLYFDLALGLGGKHEDARLIAVTPYKAGRQEGETIPLKLLGDPISAFAGFMSELARRRDFDAGRHCAAFFLGRDAVKPESQPILPTKTQWLAPVPVRQPDDQEIYEADLRKGAQDVYSRVSEVLKVSTHPALAGPLLALLDIEGLLQNQIADIVEERFSDQATASELRRGMEFVVLVPESIELELDASGVRDADSRVRPMVYGGKPRPALVTWAQFDNRLNGGKGGWTGGALHGGTHLRVDKPGFNLGHWAILDMPSLNEWRDLVAAARTHLRPIAVLDLAANPPKKKNERIPGGRWKIGEAAAPLTHHLLLPTVT